MQTPPRSIRIPILLALLLGGGCMPAMLNAESRITALPPRTDTKPAVSARLRIEVIVPRVLVLNTGSPPDARVLTNGGAFTAHCASGSGSSCATPTIAQP